MTDLEAFFRSHYRTMCGYCDKFGFNPPDVEEMAVDVILNHYEEFKQQCKDDIQIRRWMNRRIMLNLKSIYKMRVSYSRTRGLIPSDEQTHFDTPEAILCIKQRLPAIPEILIQYQQFKGEQSERGENKSNDRVKFCRARQKFFHELNAGA